MTDRVPLQYPLYGASFGEAVSRFRRKLTVITGRASRSEFWWAYLFVSLIATGVTLVITIVWTVVFVASLIPAISERRPEPAAFGAPIAAIFVFYAVVFILGLLFTVALAPLTVRRLHDGGFSGLWALLYVVPIGRWAVIILCILESKPEGMRFDPPPLAPPA